MVRYPHKAHLIFTETLYNEDGNKTETPIELEIVCRVELKGGSKVLDYSGKVFTRKLDASVFEKDNTTLKYEGKLFKIVRHFNYQKHAEIWVE